MRWLRLALLALAALAAAAAVNLVLLGYVGTRNDPVGKLSPVAPGLTAPQTTPTAPVVTVTRPPHGERDD